MINLLVFTFVFRVILNTRWGDEQGALEVSLVMLAGIIVWTAFAESLSRITNCLVDNSNLIQKVVFPSQILPTYITTSAVINMCIGLPIVLGAVVWFGFLSPPQAAIEREHAFAEIWEGYDPGAEGATPAPAGLRLHRTVLAQLHPLPPRVLRHRDAGRRLRRPHRHRRAPRGPLADLRPDHPAA